MSLNDVLALMIWELRPATAVTSLNVEPGKYWPATARLTSGRLFSLAPSWTHRAWGMPSTNSLGSKSGCDASATTEPVAASKTIAAPAVAFNFVKVSRFAKSCDSRAAVIPWANAVSVARCTSMLSVSRTSSPGTELRVFRGRSTRPVASTST